MVVTTLMALASWGLVIYYIDPYKAGLTGAVLFYATLFFVLVGIFTITGFQLRKKILNNEVLYILIGLSFRQAIWVAIIIIGLLMMQGARVLTWWDALLLVIAVFLLEAFFISD